MLLRVLTKEDGDGNYFQHHPKQHFLESSLDNHLHTFSVDRVSPPREQPMVVDCFLGGE